MPFRNFPPVHGCDVPLAREGAELERIRVAVALFGLHVSLTPVALGSLTFQSGDVKL
jgi:hypothetical protein